MKSSLPSSLLIEFFSFLSCLHLLSLLLIFFNKCVDFLFFIKFFFLRFIHLLILCEHIVADIRYTRRPKAFLILKIYSFIYFT